MKNAKYFILLNILLLIYSFGGIFSKLAGKEQFLSFKYIMYYGVVLFLLFIYAICWQLLLKKLSLTVAYANKAVAMLWTMLWAVIFFEERIKLNMIIGGVIVLIGVGFVVTSEAEEIQKNNSEGVK